MVDLKEFDRLEHAGRYYEANRLLFTWLCDDDDRAALYQVLATERRVLKFQSRADANPDPKQTSPSIFHQDVYLLSMRKDIETALTDPARFSNAPYRALGSGTFMLELDGGDHDLQRAFASAFLGIDEPVTKALCAAAFDAAAALPLKQRQFDLAELALQAAVRFVGFLFGFAHADHPIIEGASRAAYLGLNYQILGRHFVTDPSVIPGAAVGMGALLKRTAELIDLYRNGIGREQRDAREALCAELEELRKYRQALAQFVPVLRQIAGQAVSNPQQHYSGTELALMVAGLIAGTVGNVQASVAIAINEFFRHCDVFEMARDTARKSWLGVDGAKEKMQSLVWEALRLNPPVAFLPRKTMVRVGVGIGGTDIPARSILILAMGGATRDGIAHPDTFDHKRTDGTKVYPLIFGGSPDQNNYVHQCIGQHLAMPLITHIVRQVLLLPGLAPAMDPRTAEPLRLEKLWGFNCRSYPLEFNRYGLLKQSPLNVVMKVKTPISVHAEALKLVIKYGAPEIEKKLREAKHVHFAWFEFIENDSKLALHTVYDRDFDAYIEHFALQIGPLFDLLFEHIEDAPPQPVKDFPKEFVDTIRRYNAAPAGNYFFSAYPQAEVAMIAHQFPPEDA